MNILRLSLVLLLLNYLPPLSEVKPRTILNLVRRTDLLTLLIPQPLLPLYQPALCRPETTRGHPTSVTSIPETVVLAYAFT